LALIVEDGTAKATSESYVSVAFADAYHLARGNAAWTGTEPVKEAALRRGTARMDGKYRHRWPGLKATAEQALDWPRKGAADSNGFAIAANVVPTLVQHADCEYGLRALSSDFNADVDRGGAVRREKAGPVETEYEPNAPSAPTYPPITALLSGVLEPGNRMSR
jgi:hypothetical protein